MQAVVFQPQTQSQFSLLKELAKAMCIPFRLQATEQDTDKEAFLAQIEQAGLEAQQIVDSQIEGQTLDSLLDELD